MSFPYYMAKRYLRSKSSQNAVNIINAVTFLVIIIGAASLFVVLSAFTGLKTFSLQFTNSFDPDLKVTPLTGKFFELDSVQENRLKEVPFVDGLAREMEERVYISYKEKSHLATIKGIEPSYRQVTEVDSLLYFGNWGITEEQTVVGIGLVSILGVPPNNYQNPLVVLAPKPGKGGFASRGINSKPYNELPLVVSGVYAVEDQLDKKYLFASLPLVQALLEKEAAQITGLNVKITDPARLEEVRSELQSLLGPEVLVLSREELNGTLYRMLNTENLATYLIFTLVLIIALFNVVGAIIMMILDKREHSKTLYNLGATIPSLRKIYFMQGLLLTTLGGAIGILIGGLLVGSQVMWGWLKITETLSYPVELTLPNALLVMGTISVLGFLSSFMASRRISKELLR
ncbi:ABC transporter permease [Aureicoccus marinus]|uniref:ABC transporter permease n=1 Tax=Aureicoccus marinus TaxID=754435 RepID=A0A2S7T8L2_9FLAO|nr:ABC transporter permease [Aureicoccus marinus]PQJ16270.1 ABC transporter permease [Aureicoccus marinus]